MLTIAERLFLWRRPPSTEFSVNPELTPPETVHLRHHHLWGTKEWNTKYPVVHLLFSGYPEGPSWLVEETAESLVPLVIQLAAQDDPAALVQIYPPLSPLLLARHHRRFPTELFRRLNPATRLTLTAYSMGALTVPHLPLELLERADTIHLANPLTGRDHFAQPLSKLQHPASRFLLDHLFSFPTSAEYAARLHARLARLDHPPAITYHWATNDEFIDHQPAYRDLIAAGLPLTTQPLPHPKHAITGQNLFDLLYPPQLAHPS